MKATADRHTPELLAKENVVGVGLGYKVEAGQRTDVHAISVLVERKLPYYMLKRSDLVPRSIDDVPTDVVEVGRIQAPPPYLPFELLDMSWRTRMRPARPGCSIGHYLITAGTLGLIVEDPEGIKILSNNHVLANSNNAKGGDPIFQPGRHDGGTTLDKIATLWTWAPIAFTESVPTCSIATFISEFLNDMAIVAGSKHRVKAYQTDTSANYVDAALAKPLAPEDVDPAILDGVGYPVGVNFAKLGLDVQKCGRTTYHTEGQVTQIHATVQVSYGGSKVALFRDQVIAQGSDGPMSAGGDSGSAVLDMDKNVVGLLFAGSDRVTILNPIERVFAAFEGGIDIVT